MKNSRCIPDYLDVAIMSSLQGGIELEDEPYSIVSRNLGISQEEVVSRIKTLKKNGIIRRFGATIRPSRVGLQANGMVVCKVLKSRIPYVGRYLSRMKGVTHCYERKTVPRIWGYNLFFMIHGPTRRTVEDRVATLMEKLRVASYEILFSVQELKKASIEF
jgi:DNA-binding Lrp family transcriptional regulator